jgi:hypothetical protein
VNKFDNDVIKVHDKEITIIDSNSETTVLIVVAATGIIVLLCLGLTARFFYNKLRAEKARAEQIKATQVSLNKVGTKVIPHTKGGAVTPHEGIV